MKRKIVAPARMFFEAGVGDTRLAGVVRDIALIASAGRNRIADKGDQQSAEDGANFHP